MIVKLALISLFCLHITSWVHSHFVYFYLALLNKEISN